MSVVWVPESPAQVRGSWRFHALPSVLFSDHIILYTGPYFKHQNEQIYGPVFMENHDIDNYRDSKVY